MGKQIYYEDIEEGISMPSFCKHTTTRQLVRWAGASGDYNELHYEKDFAIGKGYPQVIVQGRLKAAFLGQLVTQWMGELGTLKKMACRYRDVDFPAKDIICKGKIAKKYVKNGEYLVECELWTEGEGGKITTSGSAIVSLPCKKVK